MFVSYLQNFVLHCAPKIHLKEITVEKYETNFTANKIQV